jgi:hypothetical protein
VVGVARRVTRGWLLGVGANATFWGLTTRPEHPKIPPNPPISLNFHEFGRHLLIYRGTAASTRDTMTPIQPSQSKTQKVSPELCKHPQVQIVARDGDEEYVECKECGAVFESSEFKDMAMEELKEPDEE